MAVTVDSRANCAQLDLEMSFATGEDVMRTVEHVVSDLTRSLDSDFCTVKKSDDVYLAPKKSSVCPTCSVVYPRQLTVCPLTI